MIKAAQNVAAEGAEQVPFPPWSEFLFSPARTKVAYGGRGSTKSWTFARALLALAGSKKLRILCAREFQNSITESVHRLLKEQIDAMGIGWFFTVQQNSIFGLNGSEFIFSGIRNNPQKIKSTEGIDIVWVEEAETVSSASWDILIPTIRKAGSEIWITFNPRDASDPTYKRYVLNPPPDCISKEVNWRDNPWFTDELKKEMEYMRSVDVDAYNHIWEGKCAVHSHAQIYYGKWSIEDFAPDLERWDGPYFGVDWGFSQDPTTMVKCWIGDNRLYIEKEAWGLQTELDKLVELFMQIENSHKYVIRADNSRPETISFMQKHGYPKMEAARKWPGSIEDGISRIRAFEKIIIHPDCKKMADEFRLYSYKVDRLSGDILPDILGKNDHLQDALRYALAPIIDNSQNIGKRHSVKKVGNLYTGSFGRNGWMA